MGTTVCLCNETKNCDKNCQFQNRISFQTFDTVKMVAMSLPADYGYVISAGVGAVFMVMWKGIRVGMARKKYGVQSPEMYSKDSAIFNCIQRAHQNTLENLPQFYFLLTMGGLSHPRLV